MILRVTLASLDERAAADWECLGVAIAEAFSSVTEAMLVTSLRCLAGSGRSRWKPGAWRSPSSRSTHPQCGASPKVTRAIDVLAKQVQRHPARFGEFAALSMQDPRVAARERERCADTLGFHGFLVNGFARVGDERTVVYYEALQFTDFWATAASLGKPFYAYARDPLLERELISDGASWLTAPTWAFAMGTSIRALRLMASGLFHRHPAPPAHAAERLYVEACNPVAH